MITNEPGPVLRDEGLYLDGGGRLTCGLHAGCSARYTGYDIGGARVLRVTPAMARQMEREMADLGGYRVACEDCGRRVGEVTP